MQLDIKAAMSICHIRYDNSRALSTEVFNQWLGSKYWKVQIQVPRFFFLIVEMVPVQARNFLCTQHTKILK